MLSELCCVFIGIDRRAMLDHLRRKWSSPFLVGAVGHTLFHVLTFSRKTCIFVYTMYKNVLMREKERICDSISIFLVGESHR